MASEDTQDWTAVIHQGIADSLPAIRAINDKIQANPELAYEEHQAHDTFVSTLRALAAAVEDSDDGCVCTVTLHAAGLATAFTAEVARPGPGTGSDQGGRLVVFNAEYDALPGIGHACGHNLIASAGYAAFLGAAAALRHSGRPGRVRLVGTPAEEGGGGKLPLIAAGLYEGAAACLMTHPGPGYLLPAGEGYTGVAAVKMLANIKWRVSFAGRPAHAAMEPWNGVNALDAVCLGYNAVSMLRQQIRPYERIHGVFRKAGDRPNIIPDRTSLDYYVRSNTLASAERLWQRVKLCFDAAALATGCSVRYEPINSYADLRSSMALCRGFVEVMEKEATTIQDQDQDPDDPPERVSLSEPADFLAGSTDMGNVCYACPGFHGAFGINTEKGQGNHTAGFAAAAGTGAAFRRAVRWGEGMAVLAWRVLSDDGFAEEVRRDWEEDMRRAREE